MTTTETRVWIFFVPIILAGLWPNATTRANPEPENQPQIRCVPAPTGDEYNVRLLNDMAATAATAQGTTTIVLSRLGRREAKARLDHRRLHNIRTYLKQVWALEVVTGIGERVDGNGRVELYVAGRLWGCIEFDRNADFAVPRPGDVRAVAQYYPWKRN